jgi:fructose-1-phosphate kinase PfkB-like protein
MRVLTLALHPTIDRVVRVAELKPGATFDAALLMTVPAGKGANTARSLSCVWPKPRQIVSVGWIGRGEKDWYAERLAELNGIQAVLCARQCFTRCAYTLLEASGRETHIKERMPAPTRAEEQAFLAFWKETLRRHADVIAVCGSAPAGTSMRMLRQVFAMAEAGAIKVIADSSGPALEVAGAAGLAGLKGNALEIGAWLGLGKPFDVAGKEGRCALQQAFARRGAPRTILITLGAQGAVLATPDLLLSARPPVLRPNGGRDARGTMQSATGCGDAATAGWLWAILDVGHPGDMLRRAVACGTAKLASPDPGCLDALYVKRLMAKMEIEVLSY